MERSVQDVIIVGAGMAGLAAAYRLAAAGVRRLTIVEAGEPLGLTSRMGTEAYRNWWPDPAMTRWMNRSIDLLEAIDRRSGGAIGLTRPGYLFVANTPAALDGLVARAEAASAWGLGPLRRHPGAEAYVPASDGIAGCPDGADLLLGDALRGRFPFLGPAATAGLHVRRCGFVSALGLGTWLLDQARAMGATLRRGRVCAVEQRGGRVSGVRLESGERIAAGVVIAAVGPHLRDFARLLDLELDVRCELHGKVTVFDAPEVLPTGAPLTIWNEPVRLEWSAEEAAALAADPRRRGWLGELPPGVHLRRRGRDVQIIWTFERELIERPTWPPPFDPGLREVLIRGAAAMLPAMRGRFGRGEEAALDGGYYCKAADNRPLVGPLAVEGAYVLGALSGFGIMGSQAAAELLAAQLVGGRPEVDPAVADPRRLNAPGFAARAAAEAGSGQL
ncbi:MAG: FAD-binding oxidoreductase [Myxococcales bacterium]|nr:FAD-binding oxidoreductase [Myxococcales bacterium]